VHNPNASLLPDICCCLSDTSNEILFTVNISPPFTTIAGLDVAGLWLGLPGYRTSNQWTFSSGATLKSLHSEEDIFAVSLRQRQRLNKSDTFYSLLGSDNPL
jgi:hypothetical protein